MKLYFTYRDNGQVIYYSDKEQNTSFNQKQIDVDDLTFEKIKQNYHLKIIDNKLILEKPAYLLNEEVSNKKKENIEKLKQDINSATTITEVKDKIVKLINLISL